MKEMEVNLTKITDNFNQNEIEIAGLRKLKKEKNKQVVHYKKEALKLKAELEKEIQAHESSNIELEKVKNNLNNLQQDHNDLNEKYLVGI